MDHELLDHPRYTPSGRVDPVALAAALVPVSALALAVSGALLGLLQVGALPFGITCLMPGFLLGFTTAFAVRRAHCRNRWLALTMGGGAAVLALAGFYHLDQCTRWDVPWERLDPLPGYVVFRMETDKLEFTHKWWAVRPEAAMPGVVPSRPLRLQPTWLWLGLLSDLLMLGIIPAVLGFSAAAAPYNENARRWLVSESLTLAPEEGARLLEALRAGTLSEWTGHEPRRVAAHQRHCRVTVWYCPARGDSVEAEVYLTVGKTKLLRLTPDEAAHLTLLVPGLADLAGPTFEVLAAESETTTDPSAAQVWPVPASEAGPLVTRSTRSMASTIFIALSMSPFFGLGVFVAGIGILQQVFAPNPIPEAILFAWITVIGLGTLALLWLAMRRNQALPSRIARRYLLRRLRQGLAARPDALVSPDDPWATMVEMRPRRNFGAGREDQLPTEFGLLAPDFDQRVILFEGDRSRFRFPAPSILACSVETLNDTHPTTASSYYVVVRVQLGGGTWEFPFFPHALIDGRNNWERAVALRSRIELLAQRFSPDEPPPPPPPPVHVVV